MESQGAPQQPRRRCGKSMKWGMVLWAAGVSGSCAVFRTEDGGTPQADLRASEDTWSSLYGEPRLPRKVHAGEQMFQVRSGRSNAPSAKAMTEEEIASWADCCARLDGWEVPCQGFFIMRSGTEEERRIAIGPMTEENIKAANVSIEDVDWVVVSRRP